MKTEPLRTDPTRTADPAFGLEIVPRPYADPDVTRLIAEVQQEYVGMYGGPDQSPVEPGEFDPPDGLLLLGLLSDDEVRDEPVTTGAWRRFGSSDEHSVEIKRMYVRRSARRRGIARMMLAELERTAAAAGAHRVVLNTGQPQQAAVAMYRDAGYVPIDPFGHYAAAPTALFFGKSLV